MKKYKSNISATQKFVLNIFSMGIVIYNYTVYT